MGLFFGGLALQGVGVTLPPKRVQGSGKRVYMEKEIILKNPNGRPYRVQVGVEEFSRKEPAGKGFQLVATIVGQESIRTPAEDYIRSFWWIGFCQSRALRQVCSLNAVVLLGWVVCS